MNSKLRRPKKVRSEKFSYSKLGALLFFTFLFFGLISFKAKASNKGAENDSLVVVKTVKIDVPSRQILKGERISEVPFTSIEWPSSGDLSRFVQTRAQLADKYANTQLSAFTPIPIGAIAESSKDAGVLVEGIPQGYRAISVKVDMESSVEGWAQAGNYVDVIVLRQSANQELGIEAKVIAENVKILSTGSTSVPVTQGQNTTRPSTVTLLVTAEDALKVRTASTLGKITFSLRGVGDNASTSAISMSQRALLGENVAVDTKAKERFKGQARGPDGKLYVLDSDSRWVNDISKSH